MANELKIIAVADSSFIIGLSIINQLDLIPKMVDKFYITPAVWEEVVLHGEYNCNCCDKEKKIKAIRSLKFSFLENKRS